MGPPDALVLRQQGQAPLCTCPKNNACNGHSHGNGYATFRSRLFPPVVWTADGSAGMYFYPRISLPYFVGVWLLEPTQAQK